MFEAVEPLIGARIPGPTGPNALVIRYGLTAIPLTQKRDPRATHYLEVALRAASRSAAVAADEAPPANYVFVIDTSGSMQGAKLSGVLTGMRALFAEMRPQDSIGIVDFDVQARTVVPATQVADLSPVAFDQALGRLTAAGGTDINLGLEAGIAEVESYAAAATISHVFLFSDGNPTDGVTEWLQIRTGIVEAVRDTRIRVSTFAFGEDANGRELDALAGVTGGTYTLVSDPTTLGANLAQELARREVLVAKDIRLKMEIDPAVSILHLYGHDQVAEPIARAALEPGAAGAAAPQAAIGTEEEGLQIYVPDLAAGEAYWVVFEVAIPEALRSDLGSASATYVDTSTGQPIEDGIALTLEADLYRLPSAVVVQHALGLWSSDVAFYTLDDLAQDDLETAAARLNAHTGSLEAAYGDLKGVWLLGDLVTLRKLTLLAESLNTGGLDARGTADVRALLRYTLGTFGRARSGFNPIAPVSEP